MSLAAPIAMDAGVVNRAVHAPTVRGRQARERMGWTILTMVVMASRLAVWFDGMVASRFGQHVGDGRGS